MIEFKLPELGENIEQGDLVRLMVAPGATVSTGQSVMELETDKAVVEVPSSVNGTVQEIRVKEGDKIKVGQVIFTVDGAEAKSSAAKPSGAAAAPAPAPASSKNKPATAPSQNLRGSPRRSHSQRSCCAGRIRPQRIQTPGTRRKHFPRRSRPPDDCSRHESFRRPARHGVGDRQGRGRSPIVGDRRRERSKSQGRRKAQGRAGDLHSRRRSARPNRSSRTRNAPVEHVSGQHGARLAFQAAIRAEGKTEEQALPPDHPQQAVPAAFSMPVQLGKVAGTEHRQPVPAAPHVRRLAREIGVDIYEVKGSGPGGRVSEDDVKAHAKAMVSAAFTAAQAPPRAGHFAQPQLPDFGKWGKVERVSMRGVRRKTAEHLAEAWNTIPHVTQHDRADITELEHLRARFAPKAEEAGGKMTVTAIALKVCAAALKVFPQFNASIDIEKEEIVYKQYINIGVAADTDRGLLVPVIRDVDKKNIVELAVELSQLSKKARDKKLTPDDMEGGTFTITNLGGIGGVGFTPIVNHPEVAILGLSRSRMEPEWIGSKDAGKFEPRLILPLSLSYDHRLIDGADAARFLRWIAEAFEQPFLLSVQG